MKIEKLLEVVEKVFPVSSAMDGDKLGLQVYPEKREILKLLVTLEITEEVIDEATLNRFDCIITFHPLIYFPLTFLNHTDRIGRLSSLLIKNNISAIAIHTNFDAYINGTSRIFAEKLGLKFDDFLERNINNKDCGMGAIASNNESIGEDIFLNKIQTICKSPLRYVSGAKEEIQKVAIVGGAGISFLQKALDCGADAFITADISYHYFHKAKNLITLIDPGHFEMEQFVPEGIANVLRNICPKNEIETIEVSKINTNPVKYFQRN